MIRPVFALAALLLPFALTAQDNAGLPNLPPLVGSIQGDTYIAPSGAWAVIIPVHPELGGVVTDTPNVATFQDSFSTHISIAAFPQDATQRWKLETSGIKDYLKDFFVTYVEADFFRANPKAKVDENARFVPSVFGGAFVTYINLPGGSAFWTPDFQIAARTTPPMAKRGNMLFVRNGLVFVISTELAERVVEGSAYHRTDAEENEILRDRLIDIARKIRILKSAETK